MKRNLLHPVLGIIGMVGWMLYILACTQWPSWSPDSSKVIFPYRRATGKYAGVALYEKTAGTVRPMFIRPLDKDEDFPILQSQWALNGKDIIITLLEKQTLDIFIMRAEPGGPIRNVTVRDLESDLPGPFPELDGAMYFIDKQSLISMEIATGRIQRHELHEQDVSLLFAKDGELFYNKEEKSDQTPSDQTTFEIGSIDLSEFTLHKLFQFNPRDWKLESPRDASSESLSPLFATVADRDQNAPILVFTRRGLQRVVAPRDLPEKFAFESLQLSNDGTSVYVAMVTPTSDIHVWQHSLAEISLEGKASRITPICQIKNKNNEDMSQQGVLELSLSPDGQTVAVTPATLDAEYIEEKDRALFLIDLSGAERQISKIPAPISEVPQKIE